jgi:hypothetical protein
MFSGRFSESRLEHLLAAERLGKSSVPCTGIRLLCPAPARSIESPRCCKGRAADILPAALPTHRRAMDLSGRLRLNERRPEDTCEDLCSAAPTVSRWRTDTTAMLEHRRGPSGTEPRLG